MPLFCRRKFRLTVTAALAVVAAACGGEPQGGKRQAPPPPEVAVQIVQTGSARLSVTLPGRTAAYRVAQVRPQVSGIIKERLFEEGDMVEARAPLYRIDDAPYQAAFQRAQAELARAEALAAAAAKREKRYAELIKTSTVSRQNYDDAIAAAEQARAEVAAAKAARDSARIDLDRTTITAPIRGRIGRTLVTDGALVTANQERELAVIHALDPIYVDVAQSSAEILRWKRQLESGELETVRDGRLGVTLTLEDGSVYEHKGTLKLTEVSVDPATGSVTLRAVFPNPDNLLLPGMFVRAEIIEGVRRNAILVPQKAVTRNPQGQGIVYVVDAENKVQQRIVETERAIGNRWIVSVGLQPRDRLVVEGFQRFRPGDLVTPVETDGAEEVSGRQAPDRSNSGIR